jgi:hypothetical protein
MATLMQLAELASRKAHPAEAAGFESTEDLCGAILAELWAEPLPIATCNHLFDIFLRLKSRVAKRAQRSRARMHTVGNAIEALPELGCAHSSPEEAFKQWQDWRRGIRTQSQSA